MPTIGPAGATGPADRAGPAGPVGFDALASLPAAGPGSLASLARRVAAFAVDSIASALIAALFVAQRGLPGAPGRLPGAWSLVPLAVDYIVGIVLLGQTLGMRLMSIRLIRTDRPVPVGLGRAVVRTALLILLIPALIFDRANRGLHDRVTDTVAVNA